MNPTWNYESRGIENSSDTLQTWNFHHDRILPLRARFESSTAFTSCVCNMKHVISSSLDVVHLYIHVYVVCYFFFLERKVNQTCIYLVSIFIFLMNLVWICCQAWVKPSRFDNFEKKYELCLIIGRNMYVTLMNIDEYAVKNLMWNMGWHFYDYSWFLKETWNIVA